MSDSFNPYAPGADERYEAMARIRAEGGIAETPAGRYIATAAGVLVGLKEVERFVGTFAPTEGIPEDEVVISAIPEPRHGRIRRVINSVVAGHRTAKAEPFIRDLAARLVDDAVARAADGPVDLVEVVVDPFPSAVIAHVLGIPDEDRDTFRRWSDELLEAQGEGRPITISEAHPEFAAYIQDQIDRRRAMPDPPDDVITRFLRTDVEGELLSDAAVRTQTMFLVVAGNETTRNLIGNALHTLATAPDLYAAVRADPGTTIPAVVEESLRHDSPVQILARAVLDDVEVEGCPLHRGDRVVFGIASANRDERVHDDPAAFRVDRPKLRDHLAFGAGPHVCPGASLARLEAVALLGAFAERVAAFRLVDGFEPQPNPVFWALGHRSLPARLTPA